MTKVSDAKKDLKELFSKQQLGVLATRDSESDGPYTSLVGCAATDDLACLLFATKRGTRKHNNMIENPRVAMLIDSRSNQAADFSDAVAVTAIGKASEATPDEFDGFKLAFLARHPHLAGFLDVPTTVLMKIEIEKYYYVSSFQKVVEITV
ncbi:MAG: pyridoxamine 5'-phosphate oxidase family protein [bacterium]